MTASRIGTERGSDDTEAAADVVARIAADPQAFAMPGVLSVRPGFVVVDGWLTAEPAVVVTLAPDAATPVGLPTAVSGIPVQVRHASAAKQLRIGDPQAYAARFGPDPDRGAVPEIAGEYARTPTSDTAGDPRAQRPTTDPATFVALADLPDDAFLPGASDAVGPRADAAAAKPELPYTAPDGASLAAVEGPMTVRIAASPDAGWPLLRDFLGATTTGLTVAMYDFTSAHVLAAVTAATAGRTLDLVLDHPAPNPSADQTDEQTVAALERALGSGLTQAWALERMDPEAAAWIYPTAYHIKVAVQDDAVMWLSSGNWNDSNQPDIDPAHDPAGAEEARSRDRDWHVVIEHPGLASTFQEYIRNDLRIAGAHDAAAAAPTRPDLLAPAVQTPPFAEFFPSRTVTGTMRVTPLLTPDPGVYVDAVRALIAGATTTLHMQFQYIKLPKVVDAGSQPFADLLAAVVERQRAGVEVRIIMAQWETTGYLEQLQAAGLDVVHGVRIQGNVHNKGIVVDGRAVLISSQNWSADGTLFNRDAGVIIENDDVATYFDAVFAHDWDHLAVAQTAGD